MLKKELDQKIDKLNLYEKKYDAITSVTMVMIEEKVVVEITAHKGLKEVTCQVPDPETHNALWNGLMEYNNHLLTTIDELRNELGLVSYHAEMIDEMEKEIANEEKE